MSGALNILLVLFVSLILLIIYYYETNVARSRENFIDNYYSLNWVSPDLIDYVNTKKVCTNRKECAMNRLKTIDGRMFPKTGCTYSMSCDYTNDSAHPRCYKGYDSPGDGDLGEYYLKPRNHSI